LLSYTDVLSCDPGLRCALNTASFKCWGITELYRMSERLEMKMLTCDIGKAACWISEFRYPTTILVFFQSTTTPKRAQGCVHNVHPCLVPKGKYDRRTKLTIHISLVSGLRMSGDLLLHPTYVFMERFYTQV